MTRGMGTDKRCNPGVIPDVDDAAITNRHRGGIRLCGIHRQHMRALDDQLGGLSVRNNGQQRQHASDCTGDKRRGSQNSDEGEVGDMTAATAIPQLQGQWGGHGSQAGRPKSNSTASTSLSTQSSAVRYVMPR